MASTSEKPKWLENIQNNSWEPELFISGGAIFTLLQIPEFLKRQSLIMMQETAYFESVLIAQMLTVAVNGLIAGFTLHLILRGFWIGMVCLSYVFPEEIHKEKLDFAPIYKRRIDRMGNMTDFVILLEKACSIVFALSFVFFLIGLGVLITALVIIPHTGLIETIGSELFQVLRIASFVVLGLGGIYLIDFFTLGFIKKQRVIARLYYPIYLLFSWLTLSFLYQRTYYTFITNTKPWQSVLTMFAYLGVSLLLTAVSHELLGEGEDARYLLKLSDPKNTHSLDVYDDQRNSSELVHSACIQSEIVEGNYLRLFVVHQKSFEQFLPSTCFSAKVANDAQKLDCLDALYVVSLDSTILEDLKWRSYKHPATGEKGILTFVSIAEIAHGEHCLEVDLNIPSTVDLSILNITAKNHQYAQIPFWKD